MNTKGLVQPNKEANNSLLIVSANGSLVRLHCPFWIVVIQDIDTFLKGDKTLVEAVYTDDEMDLIYIINQKRFKFFLFKIEEHR